MKDLRTTTEAAVVAAADVVDLWTIQQESVAPSVKQDGAKVALFLPEGRHVTEINESPLTEKRKTSEFADDVTALDSSGNHLVVANGTGVHLLLGGVVSSSINVRKPVKRLLLAGSRIVVTDDISEVTVIFIDSRSTLKQEHQWSGEAEFVITVACLPRSYINKIVCGSANGRMRVFDLEHSIREGYVVEAFGILEMCCDLLLARLGLIEQMKTLDDGIAEAVISIMWAAPRLVFDIPEFKTISDQLTINYGKPFAETARANQLEFPARVNLKVISKLLSAAPPNLLVERYMIEIAAAAGVPFVPDVVREDEVHQAKQILIDFETADGNCRHLMRYLETATEAAVVENANIVGVCSVKQELVLKSHLK
ncbi:unnamed protein product [Caenorhabditis brenneri]